MEGPASESLQGRNPREIGQGSAARAMGISALPAYCRSRRCAARGGPSGHELCAGPFDRGRALDRAAIGSIDPVVFAVLDQAPPSPDDAASVSGIVDAGGWPAHDVSILITAGALAWYRGMPPRSKTSMIRMRPPQQGQGCSGRSEACASALADAGAETVSSSRMRAKFLARAGPARRP